MGNINILIQVLDDAPGIAEFIKETISDNMYTIQCYTDAKSLHLTEQTDLFITDVRVPDFDVYEAIAKANSFQPPSYVIVLSGHLNVAMMKRFIKLRVDAVIEKTTPMEWASELAMEVNALHEKLIQRASLKR